MKSTGTKKRRKTFVLPPYPKSRRVIDEVKYFLDLRFEQSGYYIEPGKIHDNVIEPDGTNYFLSTVQLEKTGFDIKRLTADDKKLLQEIADRNDHSFQGVVNGRLLFHEEYPKDGPARGSDGKIHRLKSGRGIAVAIVCSPAPKAQPATVRSKTDRETKSGG